MKKLDIDDINNILKLIEDPNPNIYKLIEPQLLNCVNDYSDYLKKSLENCDNSLVKERLKSVLERAYFNDIENLFRNIPINNDGEIDLEYASFLLATFEYQDLDKKNYTYILDKISEKIKNDILNISDPLILIEKINNCLFKDEGFSGNHIDYSDPNNTYINMVIDRRTGIPITLSLIYLLITKRLNLDFFGVGMPGHFIIKYKKNNFEIFIDPFYSGHILSKQDCINFLTFSGYGFIEQYLDISSNKEIFKRMIRNLLLIYKEEKNELKYNKLRDLLNIIDINY
jgi:regulator of sirC expression with transglutaminase-like and TPR domain